MIILKIAIITGTAVIALASAWSTHFLHDGNTNNVMFRGFASPPPLPPPPSPPPLQLPPFTSFFQDTVRMLPRGYYHVQPHEPFAHPMHPLHPAAPSSPPLPSSPQQPAVRPVIAVQPPRTSVLLRPTAPPQQVTDSVHHVHVFYYYYLPADVAERSPPSRTGQRDGGPQDQGPPREPCSTDQRPDPTATTTACPPTYLPPPPGPPPAPIATLPPPPPPSTTEAPCDDTVVVDNAEYYPFGRGAAAPIVVADQYSAARLVKMSSGQDNAGRPDRQPVDRRRPEHTSNFILANYLLPPDNKR